MEVKEIDGMLGLFCSTHFSKGDVVLKIEGKTLEKPTRTSIQIGPSIHIDVDAPAKYINRSCSPSCEINGYTITAIKDLIPGDEITFDYQKNEDILAHPFVCKDCGKWIRGKKFKKPIDFSAVQQLR